MSNNQITYERDNHLIYCYFQSKTGDRKKLIGTINLTDRTLYKKITPQRHTFNVSDSIGIAYEILKLNDYDLIHIQCGVDSYKTTKNYFLHHSDFKRFSGFELQKLMRRDVFGLDIAERWEQSRVIKTKNYPVNTMPEQNILQMELF